MRGETFVLRRSVKQQEEIIHFLLQLIEDVTLMSSKLIGIEGYIALFFEIKQ